MVSYPVPMAECRVYNLEYALIGNRHTARMVFLLPESGNFFSMTREDYELYEAAYPDGIKLNPDLFPDSLSDSDGDADGDADDEADAASDASSDFNFNPDEEEESAPFACTATPKSPKSEDDLSGDDENPSPYKRPSNPEPPTPHCGAPLTSDFYVSSGDNDSDATFIPPSDTEDDTQPGADHDATTTIMPPSSPYRTRATAESWTGLEITRWGGHSYMMFSGTMAVLRDWEIESGASHGMLQHCTWLGYRDRDQVADPPAGVPELKLTTPEGEDWWLVDVQKYEYEYEYLGGEYGHFCADCPGAKDQHHDVEDHWEDHGEDVEQCGEDVEEYGKPVLDAIPEEDDDAEDSPYPKRFLDTIPEVDEEEEDCPPRLESIAEVAEEDEDSDIEPVDHELLDRLATAVLQECDLRKVNAVLEARQGREKAAEKKELPMWMRDATYVSGMSWSDMMDEDEEC